MSRTAPADARHSDSSRVQDQRRAHAPLWSRLARLGAVLLGLAAHPAYAADPDYGASSGSVFLPFLNAPAPGAPITERPRLGVSFGGAVKAALVDTGSTSLVISASTIPNVDALPTLGPGVQTYTGSGRIARGTWVVTPVTLSGADGARVTTRSMPVLAVRELDCIFISGDCHPSHNPRDVAVIGVGFARQHSAQPQGTPDRNPFLTVAGMGEPGAPGRIRRGYVVTRTGVHVGLDAALATGFHFVKLEKSTVYPDWSAAPACMSLAGRAPACGSMLMDTGAGRIFLRVPPEERQGLATAADRNGRAQLKPGVPVAIATGAPGLTFAFTSGDRSNPQAPQYVMLVGHDPTEAPFVNTSVRFLNAFDYLYDADGGYVGFRPLAAK